jgi:hypothetical protein
MALTVEQLGRTNVSGNRLSVALKVTPDSSWAGAGGEALDLTEYVANIDTAQVESSTTGYVFSYDRANKKLLAFEAGADGAALDAVASGDISTAIAYITVTGGRA